MYRVILQKEAIKDMAEAYNWYEEQRQGLGDKLMNEADKCLQILSQQPQHYTYFNSHYRRIKTKRFPYYFLYELHNGFLVVVYQFFHARQNNTRE